MPPHNISREKIERNTKLIINLCHALADSEPNITLSYIVSALGSAAKTLNVDPECFREILSQLMKSYGEEAD